jgi:dipeptide/tripeptide permease
MEKPATYGATPEASKPVAAKIGPGIPAVCICILVVELCERLAFYTFTGTQEFFLEHLGYSLSAAGGINAAMGTLCMAWAFFAGWVADVVLGRYLTIVSFGLLYAAGSILATFAAWPELSSKRLYLIGVLGLVPIGTAGIKANISNFGADQYDPTDPEQVAARETFFSWFYLAINIGSAVAYGCLTTIGTSGGFGVPKIFGYFAVYGCAAAAMLGAVMLFRSCRRQYRVQRTQECSSFAGVGSYVYSAAQLGSGSALTVCVGFVLLFAGLVTSVVQALLGQGGISTLGVVSFICSAIGVASVCLPCLRPDWVLKGRPTSGTSLSAEDVRDFLRLLPVLFMANMVFSALYNSMQFWYQQQACQMDLRIPWAAPGDNQPQFAGSFFMIADCVGIVIATPFAIKWLNPALDRLRGVPLGPGHKYMIGMAMGTASVLMAARFEQHRRNAPVTGFTSNCAPEGVKMSEMAASWMFLPFFLMGVAEIYTQPTLMHLAYDQSPPSMRTLTAATSLVIGGVSTALFSLQVSALSPFVPDDLNKGFLELGYYSNVIIAAAFLPMYLSCINSLEEKSYAA